MACNEDQAQQIVADLVVEPRRRIVCRHLLAKLDLMPELLVLALDELCVPKVIERAVLRGRHQPRAGIVGHPDFRPPFECRQQRFLRDLLGQTDIANESCNAANDLGRFDAPDGVERAMDIVSRQGSR